MDKPDLSHMTTMELVMLMGACGRSEDQSDKDFAKFCREEIKRRKPENRADSTRGVK